MCIIVLEEIIIQPLQKAASEDHPLNPNPNSQWQSFFKDNEVLLQVCKWFGQMNIIYEKQFFRLKFVQHHM